MPFLPTFNDADDQFALEPVGVDSAGGSSVSSDQRVRVAIRALRSMQQQLENALDMLERGEGIAGVDSSVFRESSQDMVQDDDRIVEGVFDGERMMGTDGIKYNVPPNYASKSKLVEGDILKLVIKDNGSFVFKQIGPIDRERVVGTLVVDDAGNYALKSEDGDTYHILTASVTYFKGAAGDEIVGLLPRGQKATWAAVENIVKRLD